MSDTKEILISEQKEFEIDMVVSSNKRVLSTDILMKLWKKFTDMNDLVCGGTVKELED